MAKLAGQVTAFAEGPAANDYGGVSGKVLPGPEVLDRGVATVAKHRGVVVIRPGRLCRTRATGAGETKGRLDKVVPSCPPLPPLPRDILAARPGRWEVHPLNAGSIPLSVRPSRWLACHAQDVPVAPRALHQELALLDCAGL